MPLTRNQESRLNEAAIVNAPRSKFDYGQEAIFDFKMGEIIPFFCDPTIMPGDQLKLNLNLVVRLANPPVFPIMSPLYIDTFAFWVPYRQVWEHINQFYGENPDGAWVLETEFLKPKLLSNDKETENLGTGFDRHTIVDYLYGCNLSCPDSYIEIDALPIRCMTKIYNDWFRNQNVIAPYNLEMGDSDTIYDKDDPTKGGKCFKIAKYGDIFTRSLPSAIKGDMVQLPLGTSAPVSVYGTGKTLGLTNGNTNVGLNAYTITGTGTTDTLQQTINRDIFSASAFNQNVSQTGHSSSNQGARGYFGVVTDATKSGLTGEADLSEATAAGIDDLINAFAVYDILYRMGTGGSRITEIYKTFWGVTSSDARYMKAEYLGGKSLPLNIDEIPQTSSSDATSRQGNVSGMLHTSDEQYLFNKGFTEHGAIIIVCAIRQRHTYNGIERCYSSFRKFDNYMPPLANLAAMEVKKKELYNDGSSDDEETFGFQESWYWMRGIRPSKVMGDMRPESPISLAAWHLGDDYDNAPTLSQEFIEETDENLLRVVNITDSDTQFLAATFTYGKITRVMPTHSIPSIRTFF